MMKFYTKKERSYAGNAPITHIHSLSDIIKKYKAISVMLAAVLAVSVLINIYLVFARSEPYSAQEAAEVIMVTLPAATTEPATEAIEAAQPKYYDVPLGHELQDHIRELAAYYDIDMALILAVIGVESDYMADAISEGGDYGLMQISSYNHEYLSSRYGFNDYLDSYQNTAAGALMLAHAIEQSDTMHGALMVYNCGLTKARELWAEGVHQTEYSKKVVDKYEEIRSK